MRTTTIAATLLAVSTAGLVTGLTGAVSSGAADANPPARAAASVHVLRFTGRVNPTTNKDIDLGDAGFSVGDQQVFRDRLMRDGQRVGTTMGYGEITFLTSSRLGITGIATAMLRNGTLALRFSAVESLTAGPARTSDSAVTGGTGTYAGATGQCTSTRIGDSDDTRITCRVTLPN